VGYLRKLLESIVPFHRLQPVEGIAVGGRSGLIHDAGALLVLADPERSNVVVYVPAGGAVRLCSSVARGDHRALWFDPRTSSLTEVADLGTDEIHTPSGKDSLDDWVLVLRNRG
jgi:hypothetical protein